MITLWTQSGLGIIEEAIAIAIAIYITIANAGPSGLECCKAQEALYDRPRYR